ncbi:YHYH domain-containing protein [Alteromonas lipotrueae]|jgi:hypothetical protein|uniref:YHYH domain-containing protein n=1 Tax=Alteromonas lipotrueae TaxID=2803814 RepID=UPI001C48189E|nr:YHYH domain-containing protein [Alteromonas lipotrueae]
MKVLSIALLLCASFLISKPVSSHGGGTNANGCHTNSRTGDYHCHTPKTQGSYDSYCHVINGERRCGYAKSSCQSLVRQHGGHCSK